MTRTIALLIAVLFALGALGAPLASAQATKETPKAADKKAAEKRAPLDINSASAEELKALNGVGEVYSKKIIDNRPYTRKDELVKRNVIPQATYDKIKDQIIAKQSTAKKK